MWTLTTLAFREEQKVTISDDMHYFLAGENIYEVAPQDCHWRWQNANLEFIGASQPYEVGEPSPTATVALWPDNTWCYPEEISEYDWMSDDYQLVNLTIDHQGEPLIDEMLNNFPEI